MSRRFRHGTLPLASSCLGLILLAGCAQKTAGPGSGTSAASGANAVGMAGSGPDAADTLRLAGMTGTMLPALPSPGEFGEHSALRDIYFDFDRYDIRSQDAKVLEENARWLKSHPGAALLVEGHADERGTNEYNLALAERRVKATRDRLMSLGIDGSRVTLISYGEERPVCTERTEACWAQNRRAHFLVRQ